ncbi:MAG: peroxiredoxin [Chromatiales bacterium]|nr:MAG: peroxiredoxin [Chromatiales bacterium]
MRNPLTLLPLVLLTVAASPTLAQPEAGDEAPGFRLQDQNGEWHTLGDYRGKWITLYFYPKDDTPGCTTEACAFRDNIFAFDRIGAVVLGVSLDDVESHAQFAEKYSLPFPLLADSGSDTARAYGVLSSMGSFKMAKRETFLIDPQGRIAKHYAKVSPANHSEEVLGDIETLMAAAGD